MHAYRDQYKSARGEQSAYLVEANLDKSLNMWAKLWVDEQGGILLVDTSLGLTLRSYNDGVNSHGSVDRSMERIPRKQHDPH